MVVAAAVAGAAIVAELTGRAATGAGIRGRLALTAQADRFLLAASRPAGNRRVVGAAEEPIVAGIFDPTVAGAAFAGAILRVADRLPNAVPRSAGDAGIIRAASERIVAGALHTPVAATAMPGT